ncbi:MmcQ/YjbR family DNA-binding protein [Dactylosporangium sp. CS-033363]|uniref:MmcQ/YjbR family DNA-binding protein n=1 Tax=Dactylosporangium sp. CS-033363 TaxID=3239935 RepID=UPI003D8E1A1B
MLTLDDVAAIALALPEAVESTAKRGGTRVWTVGGKSFAWERPFSKADLKRFGATPPPEGPIVAITCADLGEKEAVLAEDRPGFFTIPHFDGYAAVLVALPEVHLEQLRESLVDGWLARAPQPLADAYLAGR